MPQGEVGVSPTGLSPSTAGLSSPLRLPEVGPLGSKPSREPTNTTSPPTHRRRVWFGLPPFRSPLLRGSLLVSFPAGTKMFQFSWLASTAYVFSRRLHSITCAGLPHSGISGSTPVSGFPKLIAACYALHRPLTPRNPPQALLRLINKFSATSKRYSIVKELLPI